MLLVALGLLALAAADPHPLNPSNGRFLTWKAKYGKKYTSTEEERYRSGIFDHVAQLVDAHNSAGNSSFTMETNHFADLTQAELTASAFGAWGPSSSRRLRGKRASSAEAPSAGAREANTVPVAQPSSWDWTNVNGVSYLTGIKNQASCGSCWAFATTGTVEAINAINNGGTLVSLSEQQLVSCNTQNGGCNGGYAGYAYDYIISAGGLCTEAAYPYTSGSTDVNGACAASSCTPAVTISSWGNVAENNDAAHQTQVLQQPFVITLYAGSTSFSYYGSGVYTGSCSGTTDHNVVVYGYDVDPLSGLPYWKLKNQWGTSWGEGGYMRMVRDPLLNGGAGQCSMYSDTMYPIQ